MGRKPAKHADSIDSKLTSNGRNALTDQTLNREVALRIALAARAIPDMPVVHMLDILQDIVTGPLTLSGFEKITVADLKKSIAEHSETSGSQYANVPLKNLKEALNALKAGMAEYRVPGPEDNSTPLENKIRVAIASNGGEMLDGHFGSCSRFLVYDINTANIRLVDSRSTLEADTAEDKNARRTELISDCEVVFMISVGGPAAAKVIRAGIYPIKQKVTVPARQALARLQTVMAGSPPPWLAKILGQGAEARVRFERDNEETEELA